jgi:hypothetical protein
MQSSISAAFNATPSKPESRKQAVEQQSGAPGPLIQQQLNNVDAPTFQQQMELDNRCAMATYTKCLPFTVSEGPEMSSFLSGLRSAYKPPSAYQLSGTLVDKNYEAMKATIDRIIKDSPSIDLIIDESSIGGHRVINVSVQNIYVFPDPHWKKANGARDIDFDRLLEVQDSSGIKRSRSAFIHKRYAYRTLPLLLARYWTLYVSLPLRFVDGGCGGSSSSGWSVHPPQG